MHLTDCLITAQRRFSQRTDRVKGVDLHPTEPWFLANLYNGNVYIWNTNDQVSKLCRCTQQAMAPRIHYLQSDAMK